MSILLYLPALLLILFKSQGLVSTLRHLTTVVLSQILLALPFLRKDPWSYMQSSFDFSRVFLYKWTVNWRFVAEEIFLSSRWAKALLVGHISVLAVFGLFRWCRNDGTVWIVLKRGLRRPTSPAGLAPVTADCKSPSFIILLFIRLRFSLIRYCHRDVHVKSDWYSVCSVSALSVLFLVCSAPSLLGLEDSVPVCCQVRINLACCGSSLNRISRLSIIIGIEYAWNIFPSTPFSSGVLFAANTLLLCGIWFGYPNGRTDNFSWNSDINYSRAIASPSRWLITLKANMWDFFRECDAVNKSTLRSSWYT